MENPANPDAVGKDTQIETMILVVSQLFFTCFGSLFNIFLFIILKDLPHLSASTYHILMANVAASNLFVCTVIKSIGSIYISYAFSKGVDSVAFEFCTFYEFCHWAALPVLPWTVFLLSWQVFLGSRRAEKRSLAVPQEALSIFLMMLPLARAVADTENLDKPLMDEVAAGKPTAEMRRREVKAVTMREGPRPTQTALVVCIWVFSAVLALERVANLEGRAGLEGPEGRAGGLERVARQYWVLPYTNSTEEKVITREVDQTYCSFWVGQVGPRDRGLWLGLVALPLLTGPLLAGAMETGFLVRQACARDPYPPTASRARLWAVLLLLSLLTLASLSLHLLVAEIVAEDAGWNRFTCLFVKHFFGRMDLVFFPLIVVFVDPSLRPGLRVMFYSKKTGLSYSSSTPASLASGGRGGQGSRASTTATAV